MVKNSAALQSRRFSERMIVLKKFISALCVVAVVVSMLAFCVVSSSAVESAQTVVKVNSGDEVNYILTLGDVPKPVIGCDFSVYYDPDLYEVTSVADFTGSTKEDDWEAMINPDLKGEVRGNWSILKGVNFEKARDFLTVNFKAKKAGEGHLSYFIRYLYDDTIFDSTDKPQITQYKFTCDVKKNGELVLEEAPPELNVEESQSTGVFVNSVTGDSKDADASIPKTVAKPENVSGANNSGNADSNNGGNSGSAGNNNSGANNNAGADSGNNSGANNNSGNNGSAGNQVANGTEAKDKSLAEKDNKAAAPLGTTADGAYVTATDAEGNVTATSDTAPVENTEGGSSPLIWIVIAVLVLAGVGAGVYFGVSKKKKAAAGNGVSLEGDKPVTGPDDK